MGQKQVKIKKKNKKKNLHIEEDCYFLPEEILSRICSYLYQRNNLHSIHLVSHDWHRITSDDLFWESAFKYYYGDLLSEPLGGGWKETYREVALTVLHQRLFGALYTVGLLGSGDSGKSSIVKQLMYLFGDSAYPGTSVLKKFARVIPDNIEQGIKQLLHFAVRDHMDIEKEFKLIVDALLVGNYIAKSTYEKKLYLKDLWNSKAIQNVYNEGCLNMDYSFLNYFLSQAERIFQDNYVPTFEDICQARLKTTGLLKYNINYNNHGWKWIDSGGQRNERTKWTQLYRELNPFSIVIEVVSLSEFDLYLEEDDTVNRLEESINIWKESLEQQWTRKVPMICLWFTHYDALKEKLQNYVDLSVYFPEYTGGSCPEKASNFLSSIFVDATKEVFDGNILIMKSNVLDTREMEKKITKLFNFAEASFAIKEIISQPELPRSHNRSQKKRSHSKLKKRTLKKRPKSAILHRV